MLTRGGLADRIPVMTPADLAAALAALSNTVFDRARAEGRDPGSPLTAADITLERPRLREHGDWAATVAMRLAKRVGRPPREVAEELARGLTAVAGVASAEVAGPGFVNIRLDAAAAGETARVIVMAGTAYGTATHLAGQRLNLEFVSANPTGPLHIGHTRWAALGDAIARVLMACGAEVTREFYVNDAGAQLDRFGASVVAALQGTEPPADGYRGAYIADLAAQVRVAQPDIAERTGDDLLHAVRDCAYALQLAEIRTSLDRFRVYFDVWTSERTLHASDVTGTSAIDRALARLREQGRVFEADDAVWVRTTEFGDDKDRVFRRGNGVPTYFAGDAALYLDKEARGFRHKMYLLGADHHGYVHRLRALAGAAGDDPDRDIEVLIGQLVAVQGARMSKRTGNIIELDDLVEWLGVDALRYTLARYPADTPLEIDPEQLRSHRNDNPVFYVQYAHARTRTLARNAAEVGVDRSAFAPALLDHPTESALLGVLQEYPRIVAQAADLREPHRIARHLEATAAAFHLWYDQCRVLPLGEAPVTDLHRTRLWLNDATGQVLRNGLDLLGVSAPDRM